MSYTPGLGYPELADLRAWLQTPATVLPDDQLEVLAAAEQAAQAQYLYWGGEGVVLPDDLIAAFYRRVARAGAAKNLPLGILAADAEFGTVRLSTFDAEIARLEAPYLVVVVA